MVRADRNGGLRERDVARPAEHLGQVAAADLLSVVADRLLRVRRRPRARVLERARVRQDPGLQTDRGRDDLERGARHVALLICVREQRLAGIIEQALQVGVRRARVMTRDHVRVERGVRVHREHGARADVEHHCGTLPPAQGRLRRLLQVGAQGQLHGTLRHGLNLLQGRAAGKDLVVLALDLRASEPVCVVAHDVREQFPHGVLALPGEAVVRVQLRVHLHRVGDHHTIGRDHRTARRVEAAQFLAVVAAVDRQRLLLAHLPVRQHHEE